MESIIYFALRVLISVNAVYCLRCYQCNSKENPECMWGMASFTYKIEECICAGIFDSEFTPKCFKLTVPGDDGQHFIKRGCLPTNTCEPMVKGFQTISKTINATVSCETCRVDKCNSTERLPTNTTYLILLFFATLWLLS